MGWRKRLEKIIKNEHIDKLFFKLLSSYIILHSFKKINMQCSVCLIHAVFNIVIYDIWYEFFSLGKKEKITVPQSNRLNLLIIYVRKKCLLCSNHEIYNGIL